jgi:hypothetical protein
MNFPLRWSAMADQGRLVPRAITKCPSCGSTVTQFAGCTICGEDLVAARSAREQRRLPTVPGRSRLPHITGQDALVGGLMIVIGFASPLLGGVIAGLFALQSHNDGNIVRRNLCLVGVAIAILMIFLISFLPGTYNRLLISLY